jgi:hypothetical protein
VGFHDCSIDSASVIRRQKERFVVSHISRKTSEIWGTQDLWQD